MRRAGLVVLGVLGLAVGEAQAGEVRASTPESRAAVVADLGRAADAELPRHLREEAYTRVVTTQDAATLLTLIRAADTSDEKRWVAIRALGPMRNGESRDALLGLLEAPEAVVRIAALGALADRGDKTLSGRIAMRLPDKAILVRVAAARALGQLRDTSTLPDLSRALADGSNQDAGSSPWLRVTFVEAMIAIGTQEAAPWLARALEDRDPAVADAAMLGLEGLAGFTYREGRTRDEQVTAWKRWAGVR